MVGGAIESQVVRVSFICYLSVLRFFFSFSITKTIPGHQISDSDSDVLLVHTIYKTYNCNSIYRNYINYVTLKREKNITVNIQNEMYSVTKAA